MCGIGYIEHSVIDIAKFPCEENTVNSIRLRLYSGLEPSIYIKYGFDIDEDSKMFITPKLEKFRSVTVASIFDSLSLLIVGSVINRDQNIETILNLCKKNKHGTLPLLVKEIYKHDCKLFDIFRNVMFKNNISNSKGLENYITYMYGEPLPNVQICI